MSIYDDIKKNVRLSSVVQRYVQLKLIRDGEYKGCCPFHSEKTPSFLVHDRDGYYKCFGCIYEQEQIWTRRGLIPISEVELWDLVLSHDGKWNSVVNKEVKSGKLMSFGVSSFRDELLLTPDHRCMYVSMKDVLDNLQYVRTESRERLKYYSKYRGDRRNNPDKISISECDASALKIGDYVLFPVIPESDRSGNHLYDSNSHVPYRRGKHIGKIYGLPVNVDTAWLYGMYLAEGSASGRSVFFSLHSEEANTYGSRIVQVIKDNFGLNTSIHLNENRPNNCEVTCSNVELVSHIRRWFGHGCSEKRIPAECLSWPADAQLSLIRGYMDGDGDSKVRKSCKYDISGSSASTVSRYLAYGIRAIGIQCGLIFSVSKVNGASTKNGVNRRDTWNIGLRSMESVNTFFESIRGVRYLFSRILTKSKSHEYGKVVDISVFGSNSFCTKLGVVHNCGASGDVVGFTEKIEAISHGEALDMLKKEAGLSDAFMTKDEKRQMEVQHRLRVEKLKRFRLWREKILRDLICYTNAQWKIYRIATKQMKISSTEELESQASVALTEAESREKALDGFESMSDAEALEWYDTQGAWFGVRNPRWILTGWRKTLIERAA